MPGSFKDTVGPRKWAIALVVVVAGCFVVLALVDMAELRRLYEYRNSPTQAIEPLNSIDRTNATLSLIVVLVELVAGIVFIVWFYRSYRNTAALGAVNLSRDPVWAILGWIIPIVALFFPFQIASDMWKASEPGVPLGANEVWKRVKVPALLGWWWATWLIGSVAINFSIRFGDRTLGQLEPRLWVEIVGLLTLVASAVLCVKVLQRTDDRIRQRFAQMAAVGGTMPPTGGQPMMPGMPMPAPGAAAPYPQAPAPMPAQPMPPPGIPPAGDQFRPQPSPPPGSTPPPPPT